MIEHQYYMILGTLDFLIASQWKDSNGVILIGFSLLGVLNMIGCVVFQMMGK